LFWWLVNPHRWDAAFSTFILPFLGFLILPWTTLTFVIVSPLGNVSSTDLLWLAIAFALDLMWSGFGIRRRGF
jgi:hypothetical protein